MEEPILFSSEGKRLYGILHLPEGGAASAPVASVLMMVVGGPQTRVGCHRAYVHLARSLCREGIAVFRFDYAGLGDGEGEFLGYEFAAPSIRAAIDCMYERLPELASLIVWSLCDGSAASAVYAPLDRDRIAGMVLCNPFVVSSQGEARTYLRHYYIRRLFQKDFLISLLTFRFNPFKSARGMTDLARKALATGKSSGPNTRIGPGGMSAPGSLVRDGQVLPPGCFREADVRAEVMKGIGAFGKPITFLLSSGDMTALEFEGVVRSEKTTAKLLRSGRIDIRKIADADHTFSKSEYRTRVVAETAQAFHSICGGRPPAGR